MGLNEELGQVFSRRWQRIVFHYMWYRMADYQNAMVSASTLTKKFLCPLLMVLDTKKACAAARMPLLASSASQND